MKQISDARDHIKQMEPYFREELELEKKLIMTSTEFARLDVAPHHSGHYRSNHMVQSLR